MPHCTTAVFQTVCSRFQVVGSHLMTHCTSNDIILRQPLHLALASAASLRNLPRIHHGKIINHQLPLPQPRSIYPCLFSVSLTGKSMQQHDAPL